MEANKFYSFFLNGIGPLAANNSLFFDLKFNRALYVCSIRAAAYLLPAAGAGSVYPYRIQLSDLNGDFDFSIPQSNLGPDGNNDPTRAVFVSSGVEQVNCDFIMTLTAKATIRVNIQSFPVLAAGDTNVISVQLGTYEPEDGAFPSIVYGQ